MKLLVGILLLATTPFSFVALEEVESLVPLNAMKKHITLSGFSSGASIAQALQIAWSSVFDGCASFSNTFYRCGLANGNLEDFTQMCTAAAVDSYSPDNVHLDIKNYATKGLIDNPKNLKNKRLYVFAGLRNNLFTTDQQLSVLQVLERYIANPYSIRTRVQDSVHALPTDKFGLSSTKLADKHFFLANAGFSGAYDAIKFLHSNRFTIKNPNSVQTPLRLQPLTLFNQTTFIANPDKTGLDDVGYLYVPKGCQQVYRPCLLHCFFHGTGTGREFNGPTFIQNSGFLEVAERNSIIMIFPQAISSVTNPDGSWDVSGDEDPWYATQLGLQLTAVKRMIDLVLSGQPTVQALATIKGKPIHARMPRKIDHANAPQPPPSQPASIRVPLLKSNSSPRRQNPKP